MVGDPLEARQRALCERLGVDPVAAPAHAKVGIAENVRTGQQPVNGLRHSPEGDTTGWYIWAGDEPSSAADYFVPLHVEHLAGWCEAVLPYLQLPPGFRFQIAPGHEDVWEDPSLLSGA